MESLASLLRHGYETEPPIKFVAVMLRNRDDSFVARYLLLLVSGTPASREYDGGSAIIIAKAESRELSPPLLPPRQGCRLQPSQGEISRDRILSIVRFACTLSPF